MDIKISILIPTFNRAAMVCEAIDRIINYDCPEIMEVIVSDNHSHDETLAILKERYKNFSKLILTQPPEFCGPLFNWKHALSQASGTHVHWHWSDDYLCGPFYQNAVAVMRKEEVNVLMSAVKIAFEDGFEPTCFSQYFLRKEPSKKAFNKLFILQTLPVSPAAWILPLNAAKKHFYTELPSLDVYDPVKWAMGTDALMVAGALLENSEVAYLEKPFFSFRSHKNSLSYLHENFYKSYFVAFEWFIRKEKIKIPLRARRKKFGLTICNAFEKKYSLSSLKGVALVELELFVYRVKMFFYERGVDLFQKNQ